MDIYINSEIGNCKEFTSMEGKGKKEEVTIIVSPLKVNLSENGLSLNVVSGCNKWQDCGCRSCHFSAAGRSLPKVKSRKGITPADSAPSDTSHTFSQFA